MTNRKRHLRKASTLAATYTKSIFDALEYDESQDDYDKRRSTLMNAIARLSSASDGTSRERLRDYQRQLSDLEKEQLNNQREMRRDAVEEQFSNMEDQITNQFEVLNTGIADLWTAIANGALEAADIIYTAAQGLGLDLPEGRPSLGTDAVTSIEGSQPTVSNGGGGGNITIGTVDIELVVQGNLDGDTDIQSIGTTLAEAFTASIARRGITVNAKR